jgi:hypothetical protein
MSHIRRYILQYLGVKFHDVCILFSNGSGKKEAHIHKQIAGMTRWE